MLSLVVVVRCADESTETLSEMKGDKLIDEEANETEWNGETENGFPQTIFT